MTRSRALLIVLAIFASLVGSQVAMASGTAAAPALTSISPAVGPIAGGTAVVITGRNFTGATAVKFGTAAADHYTVNSATQITAVTAATASTGTVDVRVTTPGGTSAVVAADLFNFIAIPTVTGVTPNVGPLGGGTTVTITGTHLLTATAVHFGATAGTIISKSVTHVVAVSPAHAASGVNVPVNVTVTTAGGTTATGAGDVFTYGVVPIITNVSPAAGPIGGNISITITGTNLVGPDGNCTVKFGTVAATVSSKSATTVIVVTPAMPGAGVVDVRVTTAGGRSAIATADQFAYVAAPTVTRISPTYGPVAGGTTVTITGTHLLTTVQVKFGTVLGGIVSKTDTQVVATSPAASGTGTVDVKVITAGGSANAVQQFNYVGLPTVTGLSVSSGTHLGGTTVTITGTHLLSATVVKFGTVAGTLVSQTATTIVVTSPAHATGQVDVTVTTLGGVSATAVADHFTFN